MARPALLLGDAVIHGDGDGDGDLVGFPCWPGERPSAVVDHGHTVVGKAEVFMRRNTTSAGSGSRRAVARRLAKAEEMRLVLADPGPGAPSIWSSAAEAGRSPAERIFLIAG